MSATTLLLPATGRLRPRTRQCWTRSRSSSRARLRAHRPPAACTSRVAPPTETAPARVRPERAARSPSSAAASTRSRASARAALGSSSTNPAARATVAGWPSLWRGGPSARPVRAMAPETAQSVAASVGIASTVTPPLVSAGPSSGDCGPEQSHQRTGLGGARPSRSRDCYTGERSLGHAVSLASAARVRGCCASPRS
jgi:hypothetical protein